ncbi:MAG: hypothetical protein WD648_11050 [Planctomycetaceae bacterium]
MRKRICLIVSGALLLTVGLVAVRGAEPSPLKKMAAPKMSAYKTTLKAPRLFKHDLIMTQATVPPAPAAAGEEGPPGAHAEPMPMPTQPRIEPMPDGVHGPMDAVQLYDCVKYEDLDNIHPCAVTKIVAVPDPCQSDCDRCCARYVYVQICVPPCECPEIKNSHHGKKVKYDYGKYEVEITSKKGTIYVDYDDGLF